jgi:hypothetical protein
MSLLHYVAVGSTGKHKFPLIVQCVAVESTRRDEMSLSEHYITVGLVGMNEESLGVQCICCLDKLENYYFKPVTSYLHKPA